MTTDVRVTSVVPECIIIFHLTYDRYLSFLHIVTTHHSPYTLTLYFDHTPLNMWSFDLI